MFQKPVSRKNVGIPTMTNIIKNGIKKGAPP
jgi:hypothetical protein